MTIEWFWLFQNTLWVVGAAIALSTLSLAHFRASEDGIPLRQALLQHGSLLWLHIAGLLISIGIALSMLNLPVTILSGVSAFLLLISLIGLFRK